MVAMPELQSESLKWQRRINLISQSGLNAQPITELARTDLMRLAQGGTPYSEDQVTAMVYGAYTGHADVSQAPLAHQADNNPFHWIGNAIKDVGTDVQQWPMGFFHEAADIINPHKWEEIPSGLAKVAEDFPNLKKATQDFFATPIIGPISPLIATAIPGVGEGVAAGMLALNAANMGWTGFTQHPLNFLLNVLPIVDVAGKAATAGTAIEDATGAQASLKEGHPLSALAKATGLEKQFQQVINNGAGGPIAQYMLAPVWRGYDRLKRVWGGAMVKGYIESLFSRGILKEGMSLEDGRKIVEKAITEQDRYYDQAGTVPPDLVVAAQGNKEAVFGNFQAKDVKVWTRADQSIVGAGGTFDESRTPIYFSEDAARQAAGDPNVPIDTGRVPVSTVLYDDKTQTWQGSEVIPYADSTDQPIYYTPEDRRIFGEVRTEAEKFRNAEAADEAIANEGKSTHESVILSDANGNPATYYKKSLPYEKHRKFADKSKALNEANKKHDRAKRAYEDQAQIVARHASQRYWRFGDSEEKTAAGAATTPSLQALTDATLPWVAQGLADERLPVNVREAFSRLDDAIKNQDLKAIRLRLAKLRTLIRDDPTYAQYGNYFAEQLTGLGSKESVANSAKSRGDTLKKAMDDASVKVVRAMADQHTAQQEYYAALDAQPPSEANYLVERQARGRAIQRVTTDYLKRKSKELQANGMTAAISAIDREFNAQLDGIRNATDHEELANAISKKDGQKALAVIERDAIRDWTGMVQNGFHPIWFYKINADDAKKMTFGSVKPMTSGRYTSKAIVDQVLDYKPRSLDIGLILPATAMEYMMSEATRQFANYMINESGAVSTLTKITADLKKRFPEMSDTEIKAEIERKYDAFHPGEFTDAFDPNEIYMMPRAVKDGFEQLSRGARFPFKKTHQKVTKVFKVSTLSGPRHLVHVMLGGAVMLGIRDPGALITEITHPMEVWKTMRSGELPPDLANLANPEWVRENILQGNYEQTIGALSGQFRPAKRLGEWFSDSLREGGEFNVTDIPRIAEKGLERLNNIENTTTDMYRTAIFLHDLRHGASHDNVAAAMANVHKILIDVDNMTPFEQTVVKQIFPFWSFTKHIMRYVFTLPADHPIRAAVLANLAQQVSSQGKGWTDPLRLQKLFFFGEPDSKGNVLTADLSNLNPFRSMSSVFTMGGFLSGLAPEFQTGLRILGINPLSGTPSSFTSYSYNAYTGTRTADRPKLNALDWVEQFVPETQIFDHFLLFTDTMRRLKQSNPEAYARSFWQELNMPFALAPINIYDVRAKAAAGQFLDAQDAVASAMRTGDVSKIRTFDAVPFNGRLYDANQVANYIQYFEKLYPGLAPKATIKKPKQIRTKQVLPQL
jgi:hypothetical protein